MDLTELQAELRLMEQHLAALQKEVEKMKPRSEEESKKITMRLRDWHNCIH